MIWDKENIGKRKICDFGHMIGCMIYKKRCQRECVILLPYFGKASADLKRACGAFDMLALVLFFGVLIARIQAEYINCK